MKMIATSEVMLTINEKYYQQQVNKARETFESADFKCFFVEVNSLLRFMRNIKYLIVTVTVTTECIILKNGHNA